MVAWHDLCLQKQVAHELDENKAEQDRLQGSNLVYGERIQVSESTVSYFIWCHILQGQLLLVYINKEYDVVCLFFFLKLFHTASKKYLVVNTTKTSRTENTNLRVSAHARTVPWKWNLTGLSPSQVELTSTNSESCIFKILPRYKVRSVGDDVRFNDQVKFESVKTEGQFLHCSAHPYKGVFPVLAQWSVTIVQFHWSCSS